MPDQGRDDPDVEAARTSEVEEKQAKFRQARMKVEEKQAKLQQADNDVKQAEAQLKEAKSDLFRCGTPLPAPIPFAFLSRCLHKSANIANGEGQNRISKGEAIMRSNVTREPGHLKWRTLCAKRRQQQQQQAGEKNYSSLCCAFRSVE